jgi:hypothetical protein
MRYVLLGGTTWDMNLSGPFFWYTNDAILNADISVGCLVTAFPKISN